MFSELLKLEATGEDRFLAPEAPDKVERMYGGQFLAQCVHAANLSTPDDRVVHSLHAYFLRPGDSHQPVELQVIRVREGRAFSNLEVVASQAGKTRFRVQISLQVPEESPCYQSVTMPDVPPPGEVTLTYSDFALALMAQDDWQGAARPFDIRYINPPGPERTPNTEPQLMWMRIDERMAGDPCSHQAGLAYLADSTLVDHVMLPHGMRWQDQDFDGASLDHSMWFHAPARADEWLLYVQNVEATGCGRGLARGRFLNADGVLIATCMQEGLMRWQS